MFPDFRFFLLSVSLLPLWWILGFDFIIYHFFSIYFLLKYPYVFKPDSSSKVCFSLLLLMLFLGLVISYFSMDYEVFRYFAALNNISVLFVGYCYFCMVRFMLRSEVVTYSQVAKAVFPIAVVYILLTFLLFYFVVQGAVDKIVVPTLFGLLTPDAPGLLGQYQKAILISSNWFLGDSQPRLFILAPYATGTALVGCCVAFFGLAHLSYSKVGRLISIVFLLAMFIGVVLTLSRATIAGYILGALMLFAAAIPRKFYMLIIPVLPVVIIMAVPHLLDLYQASLESRQGSTDTRFFSYLLSLNIVLSENIFTGIGVKPRYEHMLIPVGSHSTFVGVLVRGGGFALFFAMMLFILIPIKRCVRIFFYMNKLGEGVPREAIYMIACYICCLLFLLFQDIDAYPSICILVMLSLGVLDSFDSKISRGRN